MKILSYDIESTTGSHTDGSMCTFGYCVCDEQFNILTKCDIVMKPKTKRYESKIKLHYEKAFIKSQPDFTNFYTQIKNLFESVDYVIGFSVGNDVEFLNNACEVYNLPKINYEFLDVQLLHKKVYKKPNMVGLEKIADELNIDYLAHRSDEDARVTILVLKHLVETENTTISELIRKYRINLGETINGEVSPCNDGTYSHKEINHLILKFVEKNHKHVKNLKTKISNKVISFSDELRYNDIDFIRKIIKKVYDLNGRISSIDNADIFLYINNITEKEQNAIDFLNKYKTKVNVVQVDSFLKEIGELPVVDFSSDTQLIKEYRKEVKLNRQLKRQQKIKTPL